jgi:tetratricopeptide (TPR) repeat protein
MKSILIIAITFFSLTTFGQKYSDVISEKMTLEKWNIEAQTNIRLLPKYGNVEKTEGQKASDKEFIETTLKQYPTHRKASDHLIELGFKYLVSDVKTAMYRFNQAYLLDPTNTDIFWGYAGVYMTLGDYEKAQQQYSEGLKIEPKNTHLLTDYGTYFMAQYFGMQALDEKKALENMDTAITYLTSSFEIDKTDPNTSFKLSVCYWVKGNCENAWKYYNVCKELGGQPITEEFTTELENKCKPKK